MRVLDRYKVILLAATAIPAIQLGSAAHAASIDHVVILSIDGLHEADLVDPATRAYLPNITSLQSQGITYTNARTTSPSDSFPGTLALVTGATPRSTGVFYDDSYARNLYAPGTTLAQIQAGAKPGTEVALAENIDRNVTLLNGGGNFGKTAIDPAQLPVNAAGNVVQPWQFNRVNTIFDVATAAGRTSFFSDKHPGAYNIVQGPTGNAVTDYFSPEVNANAAVIGGKLVDASTAPPNTPTGDAVSQLGLITNNYLKTEAYDNLKAAALFAELSGRNALTDNSQPVPSILYSNFQAVSVAQKLGSNATGVGGISVDSLGRETVNPALGSALTNADNIVGNLVHTLATNGESGNTEIILTAKHGQDPRLGAATLIPASSLTDALTAAGFDVAQATQDDVALLWLSDQSQTAAMKAFLTNYAAAHPEIKAVLDGTLFGAPATDNRTPDLILQLKEGYIYVGNTANTRKRAEHGNVFNIDDTAVPLIRAGALDPALAGLQIGSLVYTTQVAPTLLNDLGLNYLALDGVRLEGTGLLPTGVPEPATAILLATGLGSLGLVRRRRYGSARRASPPQDVNAAVLSS